MSVQSVNPMLNVSSVCESFVWIEALVWQRGFSWNQGGMIGEGSDALGANEHGGSTESCDGGRPRQPRSSSAGRIRSSVIS